LNGYPDTASNSYVPPGWDTWASPTAGDPYSEYNYTLNENGKQVQYGSTPVDYGTNVYMREAGSFISNAVNSSKPFFAYISVFAPHWPATPAQNDLRSFPNLKAPRDPAYNEADVSDKPQFIRNLAPLSATTQATIDQLYRRRVASLQAVDRWVASLVNQLQADHQLDNTYIVFTSDNGFHLGQHRLPAGKKTAYETDIHLPLLVRGPGVVAGTHSSAITGNIDLAPTMADLGGTTMSDNPDGRSLVPILKSSNGATPAAWRNAYLLEHWPDTASSDDEGNGPLEPDDLDQSDASSSASNGSSGKPDQGTSATGNAAIPPFQGLRVAGYTYVEYSTGERELYDLTTDPDELQNIASSADPGLISELHSRLDALRTCAAQSCRDSEAAPLVTAH
jgi:hypothetical protein